MKKLKIAEKAYKLVVDLIDEGYFISDKVVYADSIGKAKQKFLSIMKYDDYKTRFTLEPITYLNIPVRRDQESDKFEFEGEALSNWKINQIIKERERIEELNSFLYNKEIDFCYIRKGGYYYRSNHTGYTEYLVDAGVYRIEDGVSTAKGCNELRIIPIIDIEIHNEVINEKINDLKSRLIVK